MGLPVMMIMMMIMMIMMMMIPPPCTPTGAPCIPSGTIRSFHSNGALGLMTMIIILIIIILMMMIMMMIMMTLGAQILVQNGSTNAQMVNIR